MHATARRRPYIVTVHPDGRWWHILVPELGIASQALQLGKIDRQARDLIGGWLEVPSEHVRIIIKRRGGLRFGWPDHPVDEAGSAGAQGGEHAD